MIYHMPHRCFLLSPICHLHNRHRRTNSTDFMRRLVRALRVRLETRSTRMVDKGNSRLLLHADSMLTFVSEKYEAGTSYAGDMQIRFINLKLDKACLILLHVDELKTEFKMNQRTSTVHSNSVRVHRSNHIWEADECRGEKMTSPRMRKPFVTGSDY